MITLYVLLTNLQCNKPFSDMCYIPGDRLLSTDLDGILILWDVATGAKLTSNTSIPTDDYDPDEVNYLKNMATFSHNGLTIATCTQTGHVIIMDDEGVQVYIYTYYLKTLSEICY